VGKKNRTAFLRQLGHLKRDPWISASTSQWIRLFRRQTLTWAQLLLFQYHQSWYRWRGIL